MNSHTHHADPERRRCPRCGGHTYRIRTPLHLRPLRWVFPKRSSMRCCLECGWIGLKVSRAA